MGVMVHVLHAYGVEDLPEAYTWRPVRCPFHDDRNASASYMSDGEEREAFKCHSCGVFGNPITLIARVEGVSNADAGQRLEELTGQKAQGGSAKPKAHRVVRIGDDAPVAQSNAPAPKRRKRRNRTVRI